MLFRILDYPWISRRWTGQGLLALWLLWDGKDATNTPVISKEEDLSRLCKAPTAAALCLGIHRAVRICLMDPSLKAIY